jgi:hypothetical protein
MLLVHNVIEKAGIPINSLELQLAQHRLQIDQVSAYTLSNFDYYTVFLKREIAHKASNPALS